MSSNSRDGVDQEAIINIYMGLFGLSAIPSICAFGIGILGGYETIEALPLEVKLLFAPSVTLILIGMVGVFGYGGYCMLKDGIEQWRAAR